MDQETKQILAKCSISTKVAAKTFFPERFHLPVQKRSWGDFKFGGTACLK